MNKDTNNTNSNFSNETKIEFEVIQQFENLRKFHFESLSSKQDLHNNYGSSLTGYQTLPSPAEIAQKNSLLKTSRGLDLLTRKRIRDILSDTGFLWSIKENFIKILEVNPDNKKSLFVICNLLKFLKFDLFLYYMLIVINLLPIYLIATIYIEFLDKKIEFKYKDDVFDIFLIIYTGIALYFKISRYEDLIFCAHKYLFWLRQDNKKQIFTLITFLVAPLIIAIKKPAINFFIKKFNLKGLKKKKKRDSTKDETYLNFFKNVYEKMFNLGIILSVFYIVLVIISGQIVDRIFSESLKSQFYSFLNAKKNLK